jgi:hypothetical protein
MDGVRHPIGVLDENLVMEDAEVSFLVARVFVTPEPATDVASPSGERLFAAELRAVEEVDTLPTESEASEAAAEEEAEEAETAEESAEEAPATEPEELPTTGALLHDLLVLVLVAGALLIGGYRLRTVRA